MTQNYIMPRKKKTEIKPPTEFVKERKALVEKLLSHKNKKEINWILESTATKKLFNLYPFPNFWIQITVPFEINSLIILCGEWGLGYIQKQYNLYLHSLKENKLKVQIGEKLGHDANLVKSVSSLRDFLK